MMGGSSFGFGTFGVIGMILNLIITVGVIVGVLLFIFWLVRRLTVEGGPFPSGLREGGQPSAREILQSRYARGEITREQYQQILADLN